MTRLGRLNLVLALLLLLPTVASAQRDSRYTREANKYIALAMAGQNRTHNYAQALVHLQEGKERDAGNAKVWLMAGQVHAALGQMNEADEAFTRAVEMHPAYAADVEAEREQAWIEAFNSGAEMMEQQRYDDAIRLMEGAQIIYDQRPEALMNLGVLYANAGDAGKALEAFDRAMEATRGPLFEKLDAEQQESWTRMRGLAQLNIAQISAAAGVDAFQAEDYPAAEAHFQRAIEINPHSRDFLHNYAQTLWAQASALEDLMEENGPVAADARQKLPALYTRIEEAADKLRAADPNNEAMYIIAARAKRMRGELEGNAAAGQQSALRLLEQHEALSVTIDEVQVYLDGDEVVLSGRLKNRKATAGSPVTIQFTLLGADGRQTGEHTVTVDAPAPGEDTVFRARGAASGELAGWRYTVRG